MSPEPPRTVVRPPPATAPATADGLPGLARPLLDLAAAAARDPRPDPAAIATEARRLAEGFESAALRAGLDRAAVGDARDAVLAVLEARARGNPALDPRAWEAARRRTLPGADDLSAASLRRRLAAAAGRRDLARFLRHCLEAVEATEPAPARRPRRALLAPLLFVAVLAAWAGWTEWRFRADLLASLPVVPTAASSPAGTVRALDAVAAAVETVRARAADSPLGLVHLLGPLGPAAAAQARYVADVDAALPGLVADALATALATEGGSLPLYDALRVQAILAGAAPWQPTYLAGWLADRGAADPALSAAARHAAALSGPPPGLPPQDPELMVQARGIAADGDPADFAFLELWRSEAAAALPRWTPAAIPGAGTALVRRSGRPLDEGIPGLFSAAGWRTAAAGGAASAIARAAEETGRVLGRRQGEQVSDAALLDTLQVRTLDAWTAYVEDLRVRPFSDQPTALLTTGALAARASPLEALLREVWREVGGEDRSRSHPNQLRIAATFGPVIQYVEQGHLAEVARLFAALNVAVADLGDDADLSRRRLMDVQARAASVAALNQAPLLVVQIVEDVLAQTVVAQGGPGRPRAAVAWEQQLAGACAAAIGDAYPFGAGADADFASVAGLLGPDGRLPRFLAAELAPLMSTEATPWRWKPEARLSGFSPESAAFLERAVALGAALFPSGGLSLNLSALAQRGSATVSLGGATAPVTTQSATAVLTWPGPRPAQGLSITFATADGEDAATWPGPWGLLHFLDGLQLRRRDGGQRFLLDVRHAGTRAYLELTFSSPANPAAIRPLLSGLACPRTL